MKGKDMKQVQCNDGSSQQDAPSLSDAEPVPGNELVRYCPGCGWVGEVDYIKHQDCCPDGGMAFKVPRKFADQSRATFKLAIGACATRPEAAATPPQDARGKPSLTYQQILEVAEKYGYKNVANAAGAFDGFRLRDYTNEVFAFSHPNAPQDAQAIEVEYELWQGDVDVARATGAGAWGEINHYAAQYSQDGPVEIFRVTRQLISPPAPNRGQPEAAKIGDLPIR